MKECWELPSVCIQRHTLHFMAVKSNPTFLKPPGCCITDRASATCYREGEFCWPKSKETQSRVCGREWGIGSQYTTATKIIPLLPLNCSLPQTCPQSSPKPSFCRHTCSSEESGSHSHMRRFSGCFQPAALKCMATVPLVHHWFRVYNGGPQALPWIGLSCQKWNILQHMHAYVR